jgi:quercetin dioxygenase-like cupin family protein
MSIYKNQGYKKLQNQQLKDVSMAALIGPKEGWDTHVLRELHVDIDGFTPFHKHEWPHVNYILEGTGTIQIGDEIVVVEAGDTAYIPGNIMHQFKNTGTSVFRFICIVPKEGHVY